MGRRIPNPFRAVILWIGLALAAVGAIDAQRARRTTDLARPRIVTGLARMSKSAVDVAMVGVAVGPAAINGVGFASPFWVIAFAVGGGVAGGTIALVSQRFGAGTHRELEQAVRSSVVVVLCIAVPIGVLYWTVPEQLIALLTDDQAAIEQGGAYLQIVGLAVPLAGLNLIGSRVFIGMEDAWTPMVVRAGGAVLNIALSGLLIFGFGLGVRGAAIGTVAASAAVTVVLAGGLVAGRLPGVADFPVSISVTGQYLHGAEIIDIVRIGTPVLGQRLVWAAAEFPLLGIVDLFGSETVSAYVIARRIWGLMNTPGWGFGLAASSLVGQELGTGAESLAERYGTEIITFTAAVYLTFAAAVFVFAEPITMLFVDDPADLAVDQAVALVRAAAVAVVFQGIATGAAGALTGSGDTRWPFYSQLVGMFGLAIPLAFLGARSVDIPTVAVPILEVTTPGITIPALGLLGLYLAFLAETAVPALVNYHRFSSGRWKTISRAYRPETSGSEE